MFAKANEAALARVKDKKSVLRPKVDALNPELLARNRSTSSM